MPAVDNENELPGISVTTGPQTANVLVYCLTGAGVMLLSLFGLFVSWGLCVFIAGAALVSTLFLVFLQMSVHWTITFRGDRMFAENSVKGALHAVYDCGTLRKSQIVLKVTNAARDRGMISIPGTIHKYGNIGRFSALSAYIDKHLQP